MAPVPEETDTGRRRVVPPDTYVDNPNEVNEMLSEYLAFATSDKPKLEQTEPVQRKIDGLLSRDLLRLSLQDRNAITEEIHGVQLMNPKESPSMIQSALEELDNSIEGLPQEIKATYLRGRAMYPNSYITTSDFKLKFLRCDLFDASKAAKRMVNFLDLVADLFGDYVLNRPIQITDFSCEEMQVFRRGNLQLFPYRDRAGRRIFTSVGGFAMETPLATKVRILIYLLLSASEDAESQRRGLTSIVWPGVKFSAEKESSRVNLNRLMFMRRVYENLPIRTSAIHMCLPNTPSINVFWTAILMSMSQFRNRMKFHTGESVEVQYILKGYGIPVELIPLTDTGNIKTIYLKQWIKLRKTLDALNEKYGGGNNSSVSVIECPGSRDVVFRPGTSVHCHPGNVRFRCLLESVTSPEYTVFKTTQAQMAERLIHEVMAVNGGRFLTWDNRGHWTEITNRLKIHTKVALAIRDFKYKTKVQRMNRQENQSYTYLFVEGKRKRQDTI